MYETKVAETERNVARTDYFFLGGVRCSIAHNIFVGKLKKKRQICRDGVANSVGQSSSRESDFY
jgi:hypothetical protein